MDWLRWILLLIGAAIVAAIWWGGHRRNRERDETLFERARRSPDKTPDNEVTDESTATSGHGHDDAPDFDVSSFEPLPADEAMPDLDLDADVSRELARARQRAAEERAPEPREERGADAAGSPPDHGERTSGPAPAPGGRQQGVATEPRGAASESPEQVESGDERLESVLVVASGGERLVGSRLQVLFARHGLRYGELGIFHLRDPEGRIQFSVANLIEPGTFDPATMDTLSTPGVALFLRLPGPTSAEVAFDRMIATARNMAEELDAHVLDQQQSTLTRQTEQHLREEMRDYDHRNRRSR